MYPYAKCNSFYFMCTLCVNGPLSQCDVEREYVCVCVCVRACVRVCVPIFDTSSESKHPCLLI